MKATPGPSARSSTPDLQPIRVWSSCPTRASGVFTSAGRTVRMKQLLSRDFRCVGWKVIRRDTDTARRAVRITQCAGGGFMNLVSISCGGFADWGFGLMRDDQVPLHLIFGVFASAAVISVVLVLLIRPRKNLESRG